MNYRLTYTHRAIKDIEGLDQVAKQRIGKTLLQYERAPLNYAEPLKDAQIGSCRFRIGDYRIIFDLGEDEIVVLRVGHRREIYRR